MSCGTTLVPTYSCRWRFLLHVVGWFAPGPLAQLDRGHFFVPHRCGGFPCYESPDNDAVLHGSASCKGQMHSSDLTK